MAAPTVLEQNNRIRAILAAKPAIGTDLSEGDALVSLPAYIVNPLGATRQKQAARHYFVTREFEIIVLVSEMTDINKLSSRLLAYQDAETLADELTAWIDAHPNLYLDSTHRGIAESTGDISDDGFGPYTYPASGSGKNYSAFRLVLPVTIYRS